MSDIVFENASVLEPGAGGIVGERTVLVRAGRIEAVAVSVAGELGGMPFWMS